jgi:hypothetical protein
MPPTLLPFHPTRPPALQMVDVFRTTQTQAHQGPLDPMQAAAWPLINTYICRYACSRYDRSATAKCPLTAWASPGDPHDAGVAAVEVHRRGLCPVSMRHEPAHEALLEPKQHRSA